VCVCVCVCVEGRGTASSYTLWGSVSVCAYRADVWLQLATSQVRSDEPRKRVCNNMYDVFINIRDDEGEHVKTMAACQDFSIMTTCAEFFLRGIQKNTGIVLGLVL